MLVNNIKRLKRVVALLKNPFCVRCKTQLHTRGNSYCRTCVRIANDLPIERVRPNVNRNNKLCCRCKVKPRRKGGDYCVQCANALFRAWWKKGALARIEKAMKIKKLVDAIRISL